MSVGVTFYVGMDMISPGFFYPLGRGGFAAVRPPPAFVRNYVSVTASLVDEDPQLDALLYYDQLDADVTPALPAEWAPRVRTLVTDAEAWEFRPTYAATLTFRASFRITGSAHPSNGQTFHGSLTLAILTGTDNTLGAALPNRFYIRPGPQGTQEIEVTSGQVVTLRAGTYTRVRYEPYGTGPNGAEWNLAVLNDFLPRPPVPSDWNLNTSTYDRLFFTARNPGLFTFDIAATLRESIPRPNNVRDPTSRHQRRGTSSFTLIVDPSIQQPTVQLPTDLTRIDPAAPQPGDIRLLDPTDLDGNWYDGDGRGVLVHATGSAVSMQFSAGRGTFLTGRRQGQDVAPEGRFVDSADLPWAAPTFQQNLLYGGQIRFAAQASADGRTIAGRIEPVGLSLAQPSALTLTRSPVIYAVVRVTESLRDLVVAIDGRRSWQDHRLSSALDWFGSASPDRADHYHVLLLVGAYLPPERPQTWPGGVTAYQVLGAADLKHADPHLEYVPDRIWKNRGTNAVTTTMLLATEIANALWDEAWNQLAQSHGLRAMLQMREHLDAVLIVVKPKSGALPGVKRFTLGGTPVEWMLEAPITPASLDAVRNVIWSDVFLAVEALFRNTDFQLQLVVEQPVAQESFAARIKFAGNRAEQVILRRTADSKVYRSEVMMIAEPGKAPSQVGGARVIEAADAEVAIELEEVNVRLTQPALKLPVKLSPGQTNTYLPEYLHRAAQVHGVDNQDDAVVETFYNVVIFDSSIGISMLPPGFPGSQQLSYIPIVRNYSDVRIDIPIGIGVPGFPTIILSPGVRSTKVTLGDHAALLALRDKFIRMLTETRDMVSRTLQTPQELQAYLRLNYWAILRGQDMLSRMKVNNADGVEEELRLALRPWMLRSRFSIRTSAAQYTRAATTAAMTKLVDAMNDALQRANLQDDKIKELLELTATGFKPVVSRLMPMFVTRELSSPAPGDYVWKTHNSGVHWIGDVEYVAALLRANRDLAAADTNVLLAVASLVPIFMPAGLLRALIAAGLSAFDLVELGVTLYEQHREAAFALGASPVIGRDRLNAAEAAQMPLWAVVLTAGLSLAGTASDFADVFRDASVALAKLRAERLVGRFEAEGLAGLRAMSNADQRDFLIAIFDARLAAQSLGGAVDARTARLLRAADKLESEALASARAARQQGLVSQTEQALRDGLPSALRSEIPVIRDPSLPAVQPGTPGSVKVHYDIDADGFVTNLHLKVAPGAVAADVTSHVRTVEMMWEYTKQAHEGRGLLGRLRTWICRYGQPPAGSLAWELELEIQKLTTIITGDRLGRLANGLLDPTLPVVQNDIAWLGQQLAYYKRALDTLDVSPGRGFVAALSYEAVVAAHNRVHGAGPAALVRQAYRPMNQNALAAASAFALAERQVLAQLTQPAQLLQHVQQSVLRILSNSAVYGPQAAMHTQRVLNAFQQAVADPAIRAAMMKMPGLADTLTDLIRHPFKAQGARWVLEFNRRVLTNDPTLPPQLVALIGDLTRMRGFEDLAGQMPRWQTVVRDEELIFRDLKQGIDQILEQGHLLEFKAYKSWTGVQRKIGEQSIEQMVRYADMGWKDLAGQPLSGQWIFVVQRSRLDPLPSNVDALAQQFGAELTATARQLFNPPPQITVNVFVP